MKWLKNFERLLEIQRNVVWPSVMELEPKQVHTHRTYILIATAVGIIGPRLVFN